MPTTSDDAAFRQCLLTPEERLHLMSSEPTEDEERFFLGLVSIDLAPWQTEQVVTPSAVYPEQESVLAVHWHPEFVPVALAMQRLNAMFPRHKDSLIIPTQHNELLVLGDYAGVEIDCFSNSFNQKVQLLAHFRAERVQEAHTLRSMLRHTFNYRATQLDFFLEALCAGDKAHRYHELLRNAVQACGVEETVVAFTCLMARKLEALLRQHQEGLPEAAKKNKLVRLFLESKRALFGDTFLDRAQAFAREIKAGVKSVFPPTYYYRTREVIEEVRGLGGCLVIPHPEQFWPILLAGYDVDGYEAWNPQSHRYTEFLIDVLAEQNRNLGSKGEKLLIFMGDDCHMSEKTLPLEEQNPVKAGREIGLQPAWDDLVIRKKLILASTGRSSVIAEYKERLEQ